MRILFDLDRTILEPWTSNDFSPHPAPWLNRLLALGQPMAICTNQGGVAWSLAGGRPGRRYPTWPEVVERIRAGMSLVGVRLAFAALYHPEAVIPTGNLLWERGQQIGLPPILIRLSNDGMGAIVPAPGQGLIIASWSPSWRKPAPGMLLTAKRLLGNGHRWAYVGDEDSDGLAAKAAGMEFVDVRCWIAGSE